ncbi:MAG: DUF4178 domain-containing protein [Acidobacteriota bacterium]|nr:DUF4178 domain-containing protein [Acidobacteriota bacterium]
MATLEANCPACGAEIKFKRGASVVVVCEYCNSVIARTDRALEDLGRVADVVESGSPLEIGLKGVHRGVAFELTGRAQVGHAAGGMWDEWYAAFADGRWGWLAEAQGRFHLTYRISTPVAVPPFDTLEPGAVVPGIPVAVPLVVAERGEARLIGAEGEIPYRLVPGETYRYADLSGQGGTFATIDYGETPPLLFIGREVTLAELGVAETAARGTEREARRVAVGQLQCPKCAGPLELLAPDKTERVTCPNCGSLLDINQGRLRFLKSLEQGKFKPTIPIGADGEFKGGRKFTVIGFMVRSVEFDGTRYFWEEYLLYNPANGFRWLVQSDHHWSFVEGVPLGEVVDGEKTAKFRGQTFKIFQDAAARVEHVVGEFYWKVTTGELVRAVDYVRPPQMLSKEVSGIVGGSQRRRPKERQTPTASPPASPSTSPALEAAEINWSLGTYVSRRDVSKAFKLDGSLPAPVTIAPNQPFPHTGIYKYWVLFLFLAFVAGIVTLIADVNREVLEQTYTVQRPVAVPAANFGSSFPTRATGTTDGATPTPQVTPAVASAPGQSDDAQVIFTEPFELVDRQNVRVSGRANVDNNWLYVAGDLINEETGLVQQFELPIEYYSGVEDGESWTEGERDPAAHLSSLPAGKYTMRLEVQWDKERPPAAAVLTVKLEQGVARGVNFFLALFALSVLPLIVLVKQIMFEWRRWQDSSFNPYQSGDGDDSNGGDSDGGDE